MKVGERKDDVYIALIVIITFIIFYPILDNFFLLDDTRWIKRGLDFKKNFNILFSPTEDGFLRPYLILIFWAVYPFFKLNAIYYYLLSISFHTINSTLVYFLSCSLFKKYFSSFREIALASALIFASLYSHYQAIVWIAAIPHLVSTFGFLCSIILYIKYFREEKIIFLSFSLFFTTVAFLSRESTLTLPIVLFILSFFIISSPSRNSFIKSIKFTSPYFILLLIHILTYKYYLGFEFYHKKGMTILQFFEITFSCFKELILTSTGIIKIPGYTGYIFKLFFTLNMLILFLLITLSKTKKIYHKNILKIIFTIFLWTMFTLIPFVSPVISSYGMFHRHRYLYLPSVGFCLFITTIIFYLYHLKETKLKMALLITLILSIIFVNSFAIRNTEKYYHNASLISYKIVEIIKKENLPEDEKHNLILINFPHTPWVVFIPYHLEDLTKLFFGDNWFVIRVRKKEMEILKKSNLKQNSIFLEYEKGKIINKTTYYRR